MVVQRLQYCKDRVLENEVVNTGKNIYNYFMRSKFPLHILHHCKGLSLIDALQWINSFAQMINNFTQIRFYNISTSLIEI